jgi:hypothetical protein
LIPLCRCFQQKEHVYVQKTLEFILENLSNLMKFVFSWKILKVAQVVFIIMVELWSAGGCLSSLEDNMNTAKNEFLLMKSLGIFVAKLGKNGLTIYLSVMQLMNLFDYTIHDMNLEFSNDWYEKGRHQHWTLDEKKESKPS